jgi:hypothetical protein
VWKALRICLCHVYKCPYARVVRVGKEPNRPVKDSLTSPVPHSPSSSEAQVFAMFVRRSNIILNRQDSLSNLPTPLVAPLSSRAAGLVIELSVDSSSPTVAAQSPKAVEKLNPLCKVSRDSATSDPSLRDPNATEFCRRQTWPGGSATCSQNTGVRHDREEAIAHRKEGNEVTNGLLSEFYTKPRVDQARFLPPVGFTQVGHSDTQEPQIPLKWTQEAEERKSTTPISGNIAADICPSSRTLLGDMSGYVGKCNVGLTSIHSFLFGSCPY